MTLQRLFKFFTIVLTLLLLAWGMVDSVKNGFSLWTAAVLVYLVVVSVTLGLTRRRGGSSGALPSPQTSAQQEAAEKSVREIILEAIRAKGKAQRKDLLPLVTVSKSTLVRLLDQLEAEGLIEQIGERKASYYRVKVNGGAGFLPSQE